MMGKYILLTMALFCCTDTLQAKDLSDVKLSLVKDIQAAQKKLSAKEQAIARASEKLSHQLYQLEQQVLTLREKTAVKRRMLDDKTLALSDLKQRLKQWQQQDGYQKRLLLELAEKLQLPSEKQQQIIEQPLVGLTLAKQQLLLLQQKQSPAWQEQKVVFPGGEVEVVQTLQLGPVSTFWSAQQGIGGLLSEDFSVSYLLPPAQSEGLQQLQRQNRGTLTFDPALGKAIAMAKQQDTVLEHIQRGGVWVLPILAFAFFALIIALFKAWQLWRLPKLMPMLAEKLDTLSKYSDIKDKLQTLKAEVQGAQKALLDICLNTSEPELRDDKLLAYMLEFKQKLSTYMGAIAVTAAIAPLLGLLGTVSGMIETFNMMTLFGTGDPAVVSGGISKALITTELGLVVAIPALVMHALLNRSINHYSGQLNNTAIRLSKLEIPQSV